MIVVSYTFTLPKPVTREEARSMFLSSAPKYQRVKGLIRKHYVVSEDGTVAGGVYIWNSKAEAQLLYTESWRAFVREKYGADPVIAYFENPVLVDNVTQQIFSDE